MANPWIILCSTTDGRPSYSYDNRRWLDSLSPRYPSCLFHTGLVTLLITIPAVFGLVLLKQQQEYTINLKKEVSQRPLRSDNPIENSPKKGFFAIRVFLKWYPRGIKNNRKSRKDPGNQQISTSTCCVKKISSRFLKYKYVNGYPQKKLRVRASLRPPPLTDVTKRHGGCCRFYVCRVEARYQCFFIIYLSNIFRKMLLSLLEFRGKPGFVSYFRGK